MTYKILKKHRKLPHRIWIGCYEFDMEIVSADDVILDGNDGMTVFDVGKRKIFIAGNLESRRLLSVVWHEVTHAINWQRGITDSSSEEMVATKHGEAWTQALLDNPKLLTWFKKCLKQVVSEKENA